LRTLFICRAAAAFVIVFVFPRFLASSSSLVSRNTGIGSFTRVPLVSVCANREAEKKN